MTERYYANETTFRGAIFDLDGVVVNTVPIHFKAWRKMFAEYGKKFSFDDYLSKVDGIPRFDGARAILADLSDSEIEKASAKKQRYFLHFLNKTKISVFNSTIKLIKELRAKGIKIALISSSKNCAYIVKRTGLNNIFDATVTCADITKGKPHPQIFFLAAKRLKLKPDDCIVFEDAVLGVESAKRAGMFCIGVDRSNDPHRLDNADLVIADLKEVNYDKLKSLYKNFRRRILKNV